MDGRVRFRERELSRAVRGAVKAGLTVERVEVSAADGRFSLVISRDKQEVAINEWDRDLDGPKK
jgi:hypothetical protein